jgi:hypothetical protein
MPFKSKAQQRFMFSQKPKMAKEFAAATPSIKTLPERVGAADKLNDYFNGARKKKKI